MKRLFCWITRHKWLLQEELTSVNISDPQEELWVYHCQRCDAEFNQKVLNLDKAAQQ